MASFDASLPVSGFDVSHILSEDTHYSTFICGCCKKLVSLDSVVTSCSHPFCRKCLEEEATKSFMQQRTCHCPTCDADLEDVSPSQSMQFGTKRVAAKSIQVAQPLAYRALCQVQVRCIYENPNRCSWSGKYGDFLEHAMSHVANGERQKLGAEPDSNAVSSETSTKGPAEPMGASPIKAADADETVDEEESSIEVVESKGKEELNRKQSAEIPSTEVLNKVKGHLQENDWNASINSAQGFWVGDSDSEDDEEEETDESDESMQKDDEGSNGGETSQREHLIIVERAEKLKKQANAKFNKGDFQTARVLYSKGINVMNKITARTEDECTLLSNMYSNRSVTFFRDKQFDDAIKDCEQAIEYEPTFDKSWVRKWRGMMAKGDFEDAYTFLRQATRELPESRKIQEEYRKTRSEMDAFRKTQALMAKGDVGSARRMLQDIVDSCDNVALLASAAKLDLTAGDSAAALEKINKALRFNPQYVDGLELRGMSYYMAGDTEKGAHLLYEAYNQHKDSIQIKAALGRVQNTHAAYTQARSLVKRGRYAEAIVEFIAAIDASDPLPPLSPLFAMLRTERAESYLLSQQYVDALKDCQEVVNVCREHAPAWVVRSEVLIALGKADDAKKELGLARRTWGVDNPTIEEGYQRVDFELRVVQANNDIVAFQKELEKGTSQRLSIAKAAGPRLANSLHITTASKPRTNLPEMANTYHESKPRAVLGRGTSVRIDKSQQRKKENKWNSVSHFDTGDLGNSFTNESTPYDKPSLAMTNSLDRRTKRNSDDPSKSKPPRQKSGEFDGRGERRHRDDRKASHDRGGSGRRSSSHSNKGGEDYDNRRSSRSSGGNRRSSESYGERSQSISDSSGSSRVRRPMESQGERNRSSEDSGRRGMERRSSRVRRDPD